jgi:hypothetical protein
LATITTTASIATTRIAAAAATTTAATTTAAAAATMITPYIIDAFNHMIDAEYNNYMKIGSQYRIAMIFMMMLYRTVSLTPTIDCTHKWRQLSYYHHHHCHHHHHHHHHYAIIVFIKNIFHKSAAIQVLCPMIVLVHNPMIATTVLSTITTINQMMPLWLV